MFIAGPHRPDLLRGETLPDLLEATAQRQPQQTALRWGRQALTYAELNAAADRVADALLTAGAAPGRLVGLWAPRGLKLLVLQAGIAKSGAGCMPFDADTPIDRIATCLDDAGALGLLVGEEFVQAAQGLPVPVWAVPLDTTPATALQRRQGLGPEHTAYVIYTSGSTGKPKGIAVSHGAIAHFLRSENSVLGIRSDDLIYQGFSVAFDMSFEEIWIGYLVGATLWIAPRDIVADPERLVAALERERISVLHAVPTLLGLLPRDVPGLRLINLGGEACPDSIVARFATPERELFNTYGPTEATVSASLARLQRGQPVTIGTPLPNYGLWVRGEQGQVLAAGEVGELCITGPGVAQGYLGRPALTAEKFISHEGQPCYRSGDLARIDDAGQVHCLGRADDQVKVRGFRVELGEIEAALCDCAGVGTAAVVLKTVAEVEQLVAYLVADGNQHLPATAVLRSQLAARLPPYMVPALFVALAAVPRLQSGKIDRKALKALPVQAAGLAEGEDEATDDPALLALFAAAKPLFGGRPLRASDDFFDTLGGHSLLAARLVSRLRAEPRFAHASVQQVYVGRSLAAIADALRLGSEREPSAAPAVAALPARWRRWACGTLQLVALPPLVALRMLVWLAPFFAYHFLTGEEGDSTALAVLASLGVYLLANAATFALAIAGKWLVAGRLRAGRYPLWGWTFFRFWLMERLIELPPRHLLSGSPLHAMYLRALGARIGRETTVAAISLRVPDLLQVGDGASIGSSVSLENARVEGGELLLGTIRVGVDATIGSYCALEPNTAVGDGAQLEGLSSLACGAQVPAGQRWHGAPARLLGLVDPDRLPPRVCATAGQRLLEPALHLLGSAFVLVLFFLPVFPSFMLIDLLDTRGWMQQATYGLYPVGDFALYALLSLPAAAVMIFFTVLLSAGLRWLVLPRLQPGRFSLHSAAWHRKWLTNQIQEASLAVLHGLYATVYSPWWYRLLGARVGKGAEISTALGVVPDMLTLGDDTFIADGVMLGDEELDLGWVSIRPTVIGNRSFVGNGAFVPDGTRIPEDALVAVLSRAPANAEMQPGDTWMGSPPMRLPAREPVVGFPAWLTFRPSGRRRGARALVEALRIVAPLGLVIASGYMIVRAVMPAAEAGAWLSVLRALGLAGLAYGVGSFLLVLVLKWLLIGRYRPRAEPMWTPFVWISEAVTNLYESIAVPNFVGALRGTPWLPIALRLLGARIGRDVYLDTTDLTEFDCVEIGDGAVLNAWCGPQTHLFEDRVMKIGEVRIGAQAQIGTRCTVLYGAQVGDGVRLGPLTLVSKGEDLPAGTHWQGVPATSV